MEAVQTKTNNAIIARNLLSKGTCLVGKTAITTKDPNTVQQFNELLLPSITIKGKAIENPVFKISMYIGKVNTGKVHNTDEINDGVLIVNGISYNVTELSFFIASDSNNGTTLTSQNIDEYVKF